jgi:hypothetical protein
LVDRATQPSTASGDDAREHDLREVAAEVRSQPVDALDRRRRDLAASTPSRAPAARGPPLDELERNSESTSDAAACPRPRSPSEHARAAKASASRRVRARRVRRRVERSRDDPREQRRLHEHQQRRRDPRRRRRRAAPNRPARDEARSSARTGYPGLRAQLGSPLSGLVRAEPVPEDVVRPSLVEQDDGRDERDDAQHCERVVRRGAFSTVRLLPKFGSETMTRG